jgi:hypothetical protein
LDRALTILIPLVEALCKHHGDAAQLPADFIMELAKGVGALVVYLRKIADGAKAQ